MIDKYRFLDMELELQTQDTEHTVSLIQNEMSTYKNIFNMKFEDDDVIVDLGANLGIISILLAKKYPNTKIYSYEASQINYKNFLKNIELNGCDNIIPFNLAIWSDSGKIIKIPTSPTNSGGSSVYYKHEFFQSYFVSEVLTTSLNDVFKNNNINECKFMKVDIEGSEYEAFSTLTDENYRKIKNICIEYHQCSAKTLIDIPSNLKTNQINVIGSFFSAGNKLVQN